MIIMTDKLEKALVQLDESVKETIDDNPSLKGEEDSVYWDMCQAIQWELDPATARALARVTGVTCVR